MKLITHFYCFYLMTLITSSMNKMKRLQREVRMIITTIPDLNPIETKSDLESCKFEAELIGLSNKDIFALQKDIILQCEKWKKEYSNKLETVY